jgi:hypothetical protein
MADTEAGQEGVIEASPAPLGDASTALAHANPQPMSPGHRERFNEAEVKRAETRAEQESDNRKMRERIALWVSYPIGAQVLVADSVFLIYGFGNDWHIPVEAIVAWLSATVIQVIAVGLVITKSLFPPRTAVDP